VQGRNVGGPHEGARSLAQCLTDLFTLGIGLVPRRGTRSGAIGETYGPGARKDIRPRRGSKVQGDVSRGFHPRLLFFGPFGAREPEGRIHRDKERRDVCATRGRDTDAFGEAEAHVPGGQRSPATVLVQIGTILQSGRKSSLLKVTELRYLCRGQSCHRRSIFVAFSTTLP
jgi:hypothetical protein